MLPLLQAGVGATDPAAPAGKAVNEVAQSVVTVAAALAVLAVLAYGIHLSRKRDSWLPIAVALAPAVGIVNEPLWNAAYNLFWYEPGQWTLWTAFGTPQPVWMAGVYMTIYAGPALFVLDRLATGRVSRQFLYRDFAVSAAAIMVLESCLINAGIYQYYGDLQFRVWGPYPLWAGLMEGAFISVFCVLVGRIGPALRGWAVLFVFPLFSLSFCAVFLGAGMPGIVVNNANDVPTGVQYLGVLVAIALACAVVWLVGHLLPSEKADDLVLEVRDGEWGLRRQAVPSSAPSSAPSAAPAAPAREPVTS